MVKPRNFQDFGHSIELMLKDFVGGNFRCKFLYLFRPNQERVQKGPLAGIEPVIPVQRSDQLSYGVQLSSSNHIYTIDVY